MNLNSSAIAGCLNYFRQGPPPFIRARSSLSPTPNYKIICATFSFKSFQIRCNSRLNRFCKFWAGGRVVRISPGYASYVMRTLLRTPSGYSTFKFIPSTGCHMGLALGHSSTRCHRHLPTSPKHPCARTPTT